MSQDFSTYLDSVRVRRAELGDSMGALEAALAEPDDDRERWVSRVHAAAMEVRHDLADHCEVTERPGGLYEGLRAESLRLAGPLRQLQDEHPVLVGLADQTLASAAHDGAVDTAALRAEASLLLRRLGEHRRRGADLIFEAYNFDVGGSG